jgi:polyferredoxin
MLAIIAVFGYFALRNNQPLFELSFHQSYIIIAILMLFLGLLITLFYKLDFVRRKMLKIASFIILLPVIIYPAFRCYFKIPYVFCRICPRSCIFGHLRPVLLPAVLLQNLDKRFWCYNQCPLGTIQDVQCRKGAISSGWVKQLTRILMVVGIVGLLVVMFLARRSGFLAFFKNGYTITIVILIAASVLFLKAFFQRRFWCEFFCPIGTVSDLIMWIEKKFFKS